MGLRTRWRPKDRFLLVHKDRHLVVVEKRAGLLTVRTESGKGENLLSLLRELVGARRGEHGGRPYPLMPVHRLDRVVSGLLVFARSPLAYESLVEQFRVHAVERRYLAAVQGQLAEEEGRMESWLLTGDPSLKVRSDPRGEDGPGRLAITHWRVLERFPASDATLVEVALETGLRNQIRVHFAEAGHALLGERKYAGESGQGASRIFLHAHTLGFEHPATGRFMSFSAELPPDLAGWRHRLAKGSGGARPRDQRRPRRKR